MKRIVVPGEIVTEERKRLGEHTFLRDGKIYSDCVGIAEEDPKIASVVPLEGSYKPKINDIIIGIILSEEYAGYTVDINSFSRCFLLKEGIRDALKPTTVVSARISKVNELNEADLTDSRPFFGGEIICVSSVKIPRIIGKNGSMLEVLKKGTGSVIVVGRNGRIWAKGGDIGLLVRAIEKIEREAHMEHLTNAMADFLSEGKPKEKLLEKTVGEEK